MCSSAAVLTLPFSFRPHLAPGSITTPLDLLSLSKRKLEAYESKLGTWDELFTKTGADLREAGMTIKERRYTLWFLEKYRCAFPLSLARVVYSVSGADALAAGKARTRLPSRSRRSRRRR